MTGNTARGSLLPTSPAHIDAPTLHLLCGVRAGAASQSASVVVSERVLHEGRHHVQAVLSLAGSSRRGMGRDELVEVLWPRSSTTAGRNRLYHTVHLARQALSDMSWDDEWLVVRNARVVLDDRVWCDMHQLERAGERSAGELSDAELHELVPLCSGDWMPQLDVGAIGEAVRTRVRTAQAGLLREAIVRSQRQGDTPALRELLQSLLRIQGTDEWVHRELMRLDLAAGRRHAVLRTFDKLSRELSVQLGLRPSAQTVAVAAAAAAELQSRPSAGAQEQPATRATSLVGREALIQDLVAEMSERAGLWNFTGLSGIGKTTLARAVAERIAPAMADGVCVVNLGDLGAFESAASACARTLGLVSSEPGDEAELLVHAVQVRQMLLILDDIDAASDAASLLAKLPLGRMRARVIVTTRARINLVGAQAVPVMPLPTPTFDATPAQALQSAGYVLFQMRCPLASPEPQSEAWQSEAVQLLCRLEGLPLAIELAAARTATMTPGEILRQIERTLRPLGDGPVDMQGRHRSLQASLDWSVKLLSESARSGYGALAVFPGSFAAADVKGLMAGVGLSRGAADAVLDELIAAGLLARVPDMPRLRMLHLPRAHARAQAEARGQWAAVVAARLSDLCRALDDYPLEYESPQYAANLRRVMELEDDAVSLLDHARTHAPERFVRLSVSLCESWGVRGSVPIMMRWIQAATASAQALGLVEQELILLTTWTQALRVRGSAGEAEQRSQAMTPLLDRVSDRVSLSRAAAVRCTVLRAIGEPERGAEVLQQVFDKLALGSNDPGFWTLCTALKEIGCQPSGVELDLQALRSRFAGSRLWLEVLRVSHCTWPVGDWSRLLAVSEELVARATAMRAHAALISGLSARAHCHLGMGETAAGLQSFQAVYRLAAETGWKNAMASALLDSAWVHLHLIETDAATVCIDEASELLGQGPHATDILRIPLLRAMVLALRGELDEAVRELLSVSSDRLERVSEDELSDWAEVAAVVGIRRGHTALVDKIVANMRYIDTDHDDVPSVSHFRNTMFGSCSVVTSRSTTELSEARRLLYTDLKELQHCLASNG